jgi:hypothetical protein
LTIFRFEISVPDSNALSGRQLFFELIGIGARRNFAAQIWVGKHWGLTEDGCFCGRCASELLLFVSLL